MKTVLELWGIIGVVGTDMRTDGGLRVAPFLIPAQPRDGVFLRENCGV